MAEQWLSIVEYARSFAISDMTVRRRIKTGKLKAVLKDGKYYIPTADFSAAKSTNKREEEPLIHYPAKQSPQRPSTIVQRPAAISASGQFKTGHIPQTEIPESIKHPLVTFETSLVNSQSLLAFCEQALNRFEDQESHLERKHLAIIASHESRIKLLESEVVRYKQQVEDLQLLVKVFEHKSESANGT
jgi:hypothetical protein